MELQFIKDDHERWVSEFEAGADFNLHIERKTGGTVTLYQRTTGGGYDVVDDFEVMRHQPVIDYDCAALIYPKFIKVVCSSEPSYAEVVSNGEVTEIKSQSKEVEITANGVTEIAPDNGFGYLSGVKVNVNVPTGGGSSGDAPGAGGNSPSGGSIEYLDVTGLDAGMKFTFLEFASSAKIPQAKTISTENGTHTLNKGISYAASVFLSLTMNDRITLSDLFVESMSAISAITIDFSTRVILPKYSFDGTTVEYINMLGGAEILKTIPRITEEEFYNLEA